MTEEFSCRLFSAYLSEVAVFIGPKLDAIISLWRFIYTENDSFLYSGKFPDKQRFNQSACQAPCRPSDKLLLRTCCLEREALLNVLELPLEFTQFQLSLQPNHGIKMLIIKYLNK